MEGATKSIERSAKVAAIMRTKSDFRMLSNFSLIFIGISSFI
jgi:hypothetical protein